MLLSSQAVWPTENSGMTLCRAMAHRLKTFGLPNVLKLFMLIILFITY